MMNPFNDYFLDRLHNFHQLSTVDAFYTHFEFLMTFVLNTFPWIWETYFVSRFITGLKPEIQVYVLQHHPFTLIDALELAYIQEYSLRVVAHSTKLIMQKDEEDSLLPSTMKVQVSNELLEGSLILPIGVANVSIGSEVDVVNEAYSVPAMTIAANSTFSSNDSNFLDLPLDQTSLTSMSSNGKHVLVDVIVNSDRGRDKEPDVKEDIMAPATLLLQATSKEPKEHQCLVSFSLDYKEYSGPYVNATSILSKGSKVALSCTSMPLDATLGSVDTLQQSEYLFPMTSTVSNISPTLKGKEETHTSTFSFTDVSSPHTVQKENDVHSTDGSYGYKYDLILEAQYMQVTTTQDKGGTEASFHCDTAVIVQGISMSSAFLRANGATPCLVESSGATDALSMKLADLQSAKEELFLSTVIQRGHNTDYTVQCLVHTVYNISADVILKRHNPHCLCLTSSVLHEDSVLLALLLGQGVLVMYVLSYNGSVFIQDKGGTSSHTIYWPQLQHTCPMVLLGCVLCFDPGIVHYSVSLLFLSPGTTIKYIITWRITWPVLHFSCHVWLDVVSCIFTAIHGVHSQFPCGDCRVLLLWAMTEFIWIIVWTIGSTISIGYCRAMILDPGILFMHTRVLENCNWPPVSDSTDIVWSLFMLLYMLPIQLKYACRSALCKVVLVFSFPHVQDTQAAQYVLVSATLELILTCLNWDSMVAYRLLEWYPKTWPTLFATLTSVFMGLFDRNDSSCLVIRLISTRSLYSGCVLDPMRIVFSGVFGWQHTHRAIIMLAFILSCVVPCKWMSWTQVPLRLSISLYLHKHFLLCIFV